MDHADDAGRGSRGQPLPYEMVITTRCGRSRRSPSSWRRRPARRSHYHRCSKFGAGPGRTAEFGRSKSQLTVRLGGLPRSNRHPARVGKRFELSWAPQQRGTTMLASRCINKRRASTSIRPAKRGLPCCSRRRVSAGGIRTRCLDMSQFDQQGRNVRTRPQGHPRKDRLVSRCSMLSASQGMPNI